MAEILLKLVLNINQSINRYTVKPVYKGHPREPDNVPFMSRCPI